MAAARDSHARLQRLAAAWQVKVGRSHLYLLDSNDIANHPARRGITSELYGGGPELRLEQEIVLGIGGWRLLDALDLRPDVCHLNEGHAALAVLERARVLMQQTGVPFDAALTATPRGQCVYHAYGGTCRIRPLRTEAVGALSWALCRGRAAYLAAGSAGARPRESA